MLILEKKISEKKFLYKQPASFREEEKYLLASYSDVTWIGNPEVLLFESNSLGGVQDWTEVWGVKLFLNEPAEQAIAKAVEQYNLEKHSNFL